MPNIEYFQQLNDRELNILLDLYNYRALTTEQIRRGYFSDSGTYINKVLHKLRKSHFIGSKTLKGSRKGRKGQSYHYLTETGLQILSWNGKKVEGLIQNLYVKPDQLHYILLANDLMVELRPSGWEIWDSRRLKKEYRLDSRMHILGLLREPDDRTYGFYILEEEILPTTLGRIQAEIRDHCQTIKNYIIFTKGSSAHNNFIKNALEPSPKRVGNKIVPQLPIYTGYELKVVPFKLGIELLKVFPTRKEKLISFSNFIGFEILSDRIEMFDKIRNGEQRRQSFDTIISYQGEEMYLVDLTESDLTLLMKINQYTEHNYLMENRRSLLVIRLSDFPTEWITNKSSFIKFKPITFNY